MSVDHNEPTVDVHAFDIWDDSQVQNIFDIFAEMNRTGSVTWAETYGGHWVVTGYEAVRQVGQDWRTFTSEQGVQHPPIGSENTPPITVDPPLQRSYRKLLNPFFSPTLVAEMEPAVRGHVTALIDKFIESGRCDLTMDFAEPLVPLVFYTDVVHVPNNLMGSFMEKTVVQGATPREHNAAVHEISGELVRARRDQPPLGDVIDATFNATIDGRRLTDDEIAGVVELLILGGTDTTRNVIASALHYLSEHSATREELIQHPHRIPPAVEEFLRLFGSVQTIGRTATCDTVVGSVPIAQGSKVICALAAAGRDPSEFSSPNDLDLDRRANRHLAFGVGPHRCLGSHLARLEIQVALEEVLARLPDYRLADDWHYHRKRGFIHGPESLPVTFTPGARRGPADA
jgi:cytochrome P450